MLHHAARPVPWPVKTLITFTAVILVLGVGIASASAGPAPGRKLATLKAVGAAEDFGNAVALSGSTAVVGADGEGADPAAPGKVLVFTKTAKGWKQTAGLEASDHIAGDEFGYSVAISGSTIVVGAPYPSNNNDTGRIYIFTKTTKGWKQAAEIKDPDPVSANDADDLFGYSVATTGNSLYAGSPGYGATSGAIYGTVFAYTKTASGWKQTAKFRPSSSAGDGLGGSLAASGSTVVSGSVPCETCANSAAYVFTHAKSRWTQDRLRSSISGDGFGASVSISGPEIAVGAPYQADFRGRVYAFAKSRTGWKQTAELRHKSLILEYGLSVGISGNALVASDLGAAGEVYFYARTKTGWKYVTTVDLAPRGNANGGGPLSVSGSLALAGAGAGHAIGRAFILEA
jgi:hypothetical protein